MVGAMDGSSKGNGILAVMFFALALGVAATFVPEESRTLVDWLRGLNAVSMVIIGFAMRLAPLGVACLVFSITARLGLAMFPPLVGFVATVLLAMLAQLLVVYSLVLWWFGGVSPRFFFGRIAEAMVMAFGTSSSNATLPTSLRVAQDRLGLPQGVSSFVLTVGATGNQNGTALYEGIVVLFLAQVFHVELTLFQQILVVVMAVLAGVGTAGIPGGSLPMIVIVLQSVGVPGEGIGIILGIDRILDMCRTVLNVTGDLAVAQCVARGEPAST
jgi:DAACS family dicarboxylate/amino acid:cation (Na+ or H+) symporter